MIKSKNSKWLILCVLLGIAFCSAGLQFLSFSADYKTFFDKDNKELIKMEELQETYSKPDNVFVMISSPQDDVFNIESITLIHELTQAFWQVPHSSRVDSITNYSHSVAQQNDILIEEFVYEKEEITTKLVNYMKSKVLIEHDLLSKLITDTGKHTAINITLTLPSKDMKKETIEVKQSVDNILDQFKTKYPKHEFNVSGLVIMNGTFMEVAKKDIITLIPLMMLFVLIVAGIILGSVKAAIIILGVVILCFTGALGVAGWVGIQLSSPSVSAPIIMFTIIVASSIHIITYVKNRRVQGINSKQAVLDSYNKNLNPVVLSHLTTIIGFLAMNNGSSPPFRDLGNIVVIGVILSLVISLTLLPFVLSKVNISNKPSLLNKTRLLSQILAEFVIRYRKAVLWFIVPVSILIFSLSFNNQLDDNLIQYFDRSVEFRQHADKVDKHFSGISNIDYSLETGEINSIFEPSYLAFVEKFEGWLNNQSEVVAVDSALHRIKNLNRLVHQNDDKFYVISEDKTHNAQNFLLYEMSLPFGRDTSNIIRMDKSGLKVTVRLKNQSSQEILDFESKVNTWLAENEHNDIQVQYSSPSIIFSNIGQTNIKNMLQGAFMALLIISLGMMFIFRSFLVGLSSLIPNILPIAAAYGTWYLIDGRISMGLASVAAMTIGIVVDDTVHFYFQYLRGLKKGLSPENAIRETFDSTISAIIISSLLLIAGFMLLTFSSFQKNADIGLLTSITIWLALIFDIFMLPALALTFHKKVKHTKVKEVTCKASAT